MPVTTQNVTQVFTYSAPDADMIPALARVRDKARELAEVILANTPSCADQQAALRLVREAVMTANASIVLKGAV